MTSDSKQGSSFTGKYDLETKTARPKSVGPHDVTHEQEDPADKGIDPQKGYAHEIAEVNAARRKGETADESGGTADMLKK